MDKSKLTDFERALMSSSPKWVKDIMKAQEQRIRELEKQLQAARKEQPRSRVFQEVGHNVGTQGPGAPGGGSLEHQHPSHPTLQQRAVAPMTTHVIMIPWGRSYDNQYLAVSPEDAGPILQAILDARIVKGDGYSIDDNTTFEDCEMDLSGLRKLPITRLFPPPLQFVEEKEEQRLDDVDAAGEAAAASSDLEARIEEARAGDPPAELT